MSRKNIRNSFNNVDVLILCGGLGTRLWSVVSDRPKVMAEIGDRPFLEMVVDELLEQGFKRIIFCTGYLGNHIEEYFKKRSYSKSVTLEFSREEKPLGTGGAVKNTFKLIESEHFLVINGDSFPRLRFEDFYLNHIERHIPLSIALVKSHNAHEYGNVVLAKNDEIASFIEKDKKESSGFISAGCYVMSKSIEGYFPEQDGFSLEYDVFPQLAGKSYGFVFDGKFLDIGTPDRYASAESFFT